MRDHRLDEEMMRALGSEQPDDPNHDERLRELAALKAEWDARATRSRPGGDAVTTIREGTLRGYPDLGGWDASDRFGHPRAEDVPCVVVTGRTADQVRLALDVLDARDRIFPGANPGAKEATPVTTARDAVAGAITEAQVRNRDSAGFSALQVLAVLGIPPEMTVDDVTAALILWDDPGVTVKRTPAGWKAESRESKTFGNTKAEAVIALAAKMEATA